MKKFLYVIAFLALGLCISRLAAVVMTPSSFTVTETGAAIYNIPIQVPPGTAGMEPKLSLTYSNQGGNGLLGVGWSLAGLSAITRCGRTIAQDGFNAGVSYETNDRYCLDGQRLIVYAGTNGQNGAEYRTERDSFAKVISYGVAGNGPSWFKVWTKSGQIMEFGNTTKSKVEAAGKTSVRVFALNRITDTKGNYLTVDYEEDNPTGDFWPTRIDYTGNAAAGLSTGFYVQFIYEARTDETPQYLGGAIIKMTKRLKNVKTYVGATLVRDYRLIYSNAGSQNYSRLNSVTECGGAVPTCFPATTFTWQDSTGVTGFDSRAWDVYGQSGSAVWQVADFNGDGRIDILFANDTNLMVQYSTEVGFSPPGPAGYDESGSCDGLPCARAIAGDVNGDGRADIIMGNGYVSLWTPSGFATPTNWGALPPAVVWRTGDFNGDGRADILRNDGAGTLYIQYSTGTSFGAPVFLATFSGEAMGGDVDGDGRSDVILSDGTVMISKEGGFAPPVPWGGGYSWSTWWAADFNGDGKADLLHEWSSGAYMQYSTGVGFGPLTGPIPLYGGRAALGDLNGDGVADIITADPNTYWPASTPSADLITTFNNGIGLITTVTYQKIDYAGGVYTAETNATFPMRDLLGAERLYVVGSYTRTDGIGGTYQTSYKYTGAKVHLRGRGFLGFRIVQATDPQGLRSISTFKQDFPYIGLPSQVKKTKSDGTTMLNQIDNTYGCKDFDANPDVCTVAAGKRYFPYMSQSVEQSKDWNGAVLPTVTTSNVFDTYGNATQIVVGTGDGYSKTTTNTYTNNATSWLLGRLTRSTVQSTTP